MFKHLEGNDDIEDAWSQAKLLPVPYIADYARRRSRIDVLEALNTPLFEVPRDPTVTAADFEHGVGRLHAIKKVVLIGVAGTDC